MAAAIIELTTKKNIDEKTNTDIRTAPTDSINQAREAVKIYTGHPAPTFGERINSALNMGGIPIDALLPKLQLNPNIHYTEAQRRYINYAWQISKEDEFSYMLKAENGKIGPGTIHDTTYWCSSSQTWETDYGFCGISKCYHRSTVEDPRFFTDWRWQMRQCYDKYKGGTTFYGLIRIRTEPAYLKVIKGHFIKR